MAHAAAAIIDADAATTNTTHSSIGQGHPTSLAARKLSANRLSIVDRLAARSVTGRSLHILVHQHYGYRLHLEWSGGGDCQNASRFMERQFDMSCQSQSFCTQLCHRGLDGLCTCIYESHNFHPHQRAPRCLREPLLLSQKLLAQPKLWIKAKQDLGGGPHCGCKITSSAITWMDVK